MKLRRTAMLMLLLVAQTALGFQFSSGQHRPPTDENLAKIRKRLAEHPELMEATRELSPAFAESKLKLEHAYPRLVKTVNAGKLSFPVFHVLWRGLVAKDADMHEVLAQFESGKVGVKGFVKRLQAWDARVTIFEGMTCSDCSWLTDTYVAGCRAGGGGDWFCFIVGEQYICVCYNALCEPLGVLDCGVLWVP